MSLFTSVKFYHFYVETNRKEFKNKSVIMLCTRGVLNMIHFSKISSLMTKHQNTDFGKSVGLKIFQLVLIIIATQFFLLINTKIYHIYSKFLSVGLQIDWLILIFLFFISFCNILSMHPMIFLGYLLRMQHLKKARCYTTETI